MAREDNSRILALSRVLRYSGFWKLVALALALINLKTLPFVWHLRLFKGLFIHIRRSVRFTPTTGPRALFQPMIISSYSPLLECDYNLHKSNSTYFSDLDISRTHLITALCSRGIGNVRKELDVGAQGRFSVMLGGVSCTFRREIKPYQEYEIWSRVLCWDRKWVYIVSHFVKKGRVKPSGYTLQPKKLVAIVRDRSGPEEEKGERSGLPVTTPDGTNPAIFASAISKYVFKKGRLTIPPERILEASNLLPPKPAEHHTASVSPSPLRGEGTALDTQAASLLQSLKTESVDAGIDASLRPDGSDDEVWDWTRVETERVRGLKIAEMMAGLDSLHDEFTADGEPVLGQF